MFINVGTKISNKVTTQNNLPAIENGYLKDCLQMKHFTHSRNNKNIYFI